MNLYKAEKFLKSKGVDTEKYVIHDIKGEYLPQIPIALWLEEFAQERVKSNVVLDDVIKHRELLIDFHKSLYSEIGWITDKEHALEGIDKYLKSINS